MSRVNYRRLKSGVNAVTGGVDSATVRARARLCEGMPLCCGNKHTVYLQLWLQVYDSIKIIIFGQILNIRRAVTEANNK